MNNNNILLDEFSNNINNESHLANEIFSYKENSKFKDFVSNEYSVNLEENKSIKRSLKSKKSINFFNVAKMFAVVTTFVVTVAVIAVVLSASAKIVNYIFGDDYLSYDILIEEIGEEELYISVSNAYYEEKRIAIEGRNSGFFEDLKPNTYYTLKVEGTSEFGYKTYESIRFKTTYDKPKATITNLNTIIENNLQFLNFDYIFSDKYDYIRDVSLVYKYGYSYEHEEETFDSILYEDSLNFDKLSKNYTLDVQVSGGYYFNYHLEYYLNDELVVTEENSYIIPIITHVEMFTEILDDDSVLFTGYLENSNSKDLYLYVYNSADHQEQYKFYLKDYFGGTHGQEEYNQFFTISIPDLSKDVTYNFEIKDEKVYYNSWFIIGDYYTVSDVDYLFNVNNNGNANITFDFTKVVNPDNYNCSFGVDYVYTFNDQNLTGRYYFQNDNYILPNSFPQGGVLELRFFQSINNINHYKEVISLDISSELIRITNFEESYFDDNQQLSFSLILLDLLNQVTDIKLYYEVVQVFEYEGEVLEEVIIEKDISVTNVSQTLMFDEYINGGNIFRYHFEYLLNGIPNRMEEREYNILYIPFVNAYFQLGENSAVIFNGDIFNNPQNEEISLTVFNDNENFVFILNDHLLPPMEQYGEEFDQFQVIVPNLNKDILYSFIIEGNYIYFQDEFFIASNPESLYEIETVNIVNQVNPNNFKVNTEIINTDLFNQITNLSLVYSYENLYGTVTDSIPVYSYITNYDFTNEFTYGITINLSLLGTFNNEVIVIDEKNMQLGNPNKYYELSNLDYYFDQYKEGMATLAFDFINNDLNGYVSEFGFDYTYTLLEEEILEGNIYNINGTFDVLDLPTGGILECKFYQIINSVKEYKDILILDVLKTPVVFEFNNVFNSQQFLTSNFIIYNLLNMSYYIKIFDYEDNEIGSNIVNDGYNEVNFYNLGYDSNYTIKIVDEIGAVIAEQKIRTLPQGVFVQFNIFEIIDQPTGAKIKFSYLVNDPELFNPIIKVKYNNTDLNEINHTYIKYLDNSLETFETEEVFDLNTVITFMLIYEYLDREIILQIADIYLATPA